MRQVFFFLLGLNIIGLIVVTSDYLRVRHLQTPTTQSIYLQETENTNLTTQSHNFDDSVIAFKLLQELDIFENGENDTTDNTKYILYGMTIDDNYCDKHRAYFVSNPDYVFTQKNFLTDYSRGETIRYITIPSVGQDIHPNISAAMPKEKRSGYFEDLKPEINNFYTHASICKYRVVGKHFSCLTQISNHCPGRENLVVKDKVGGALVEYSRTYKNRPQCFSTDKFFPQTWVMLNPEQCRSFFEEFNSPEYFKLKEERNIVYMRKIGANVHKGQGVFPVNDEDENYIRTLYENGTNCEDVTENNVMQTFIHNPLLLENRKFHFRVFMYIASTNPFIVYYHDGYLRISFQQYDSTSTERGTFVTNLGMNTLLFKDKDGLPENRTSDQLKEDSYWYYPQFHKYLTEQGRVVDPNWLDNYLRNEMKKAMIHLIRMSQSKYWKKSSVSELYGVDFMMDDNLNLWFIEANPGPLIHGWDDKTVQFFDKMLRDVFKISFGLLRSRTKRIIKYINNLVREKDAWKFEDGNFEVKNLEERREEFKKITMNRFELEFTPSQENEFYQIIDENLEGKRRYFDLLEEECL